MSKLTLGQHYLKSALFLANAAYAAYDDAPKTYKGFEHLGFNSCLPFCSDANKNKQATRGYIAERDDAIVLAFRGTDDVQDWLINLNFLQMQDGGAMIHQGFNLALASVWEHVDPLLRKLVAEKKRKIWITGHSLGGALATLATRRIANMKLGAIETFTFGQPKVGDAAFAKQITTTLYRFAYCSDPVTFAPFSVPKTAQYEHAGTLKQIDANGKIHEDATNFLTHLVSAAQSVKKMTSDLFGSDIKTFVKERIADHFMPNYVDKIAKALQL